MELAITIGIIVLIWVYIFYDRSTEKKKYLDNTYLFHLQQITSFFETVNALNDYTTWVQRDQIKLNYSETENYFKELEHSKQGKSKSWSGKGY